jgi:hypothetical protein
MPDQVFVVAELGMLGVIVALQVIVPPVVIFAAGHMPVSAIIIIIPAIVILVLFMIIIRLIILAQVCVTQVNVLGVPVLFVSVPLGIVAMAVIFGAPRMFVVTMANL